MKNSDVFNRILADIPKEDLIFDDVSLAFSQKIYQALEKKGLSLKEFAVLLGSDELTVSRQLSGDTDLTLKTIAKMLSALSLDMKINLYSLSMEIIFEYTDETAG